MDYKKTYLNKEVYYLMKNWKLNIPTRYMINNDGIKVESNIELEKHYPYLELAYAPNIYEVLKYVKEHLYIDIKINKLEDNKWEWIMLTKNHTIYSGETIKGNFGSNDPKTRMYFKNELETINDAIIEMIIIL